MIQSKMCQCEGHEQNKVKYICLDVKCQQNFFCSKCYIEERHKHENLKSENTYDHLGLQVYINKQIVYLKNQLPKAQDGFVQKCIQLLSELQKSMNIIIDNLQKIQTKSYIQQKIYLLEQQLESIYQSKLNQVDDSFIRELLNMDFQNDQKDIIREITYQSELFSKNGNLIQYALKSQAFQYETIQFDQLNDQIIYSAAISNDAKYLVTNQKDLILRIWNINDQKVIQEYNLREKIFISKFTNDDTLLYVGSGYGLLCCYDVQNNFKWIFKEKIHSDGILNLYCVSNNIILTASFDKQIIKTDTLSNSQLLCIKAHDDRIDGLDYNYTKDVIASCSKDNFIKIWCNKSGQQLIQQQSDYQSMFNQVLFIDRYDQLVSLDGKGTINIWNIKYDTKESIRFMTIQNQKMTFNISLVLNQEVIYALCQNYVRLYYQGELFYTIQHDIQDFCIYSSILLNRYDSISLNEFYAVNTNLRQMQNIIIYLEQLKILKLKQ